MQITRELPEPTIPEGQSPSKSIATLVDKTQWMTDDVILVPSIAAQSAIQMGRAS